MKLEKAMKHDKKQHKEKHGMQVSGRPTAIQNAILKRAGSLRKAL